MHDFDRQPFATEDAAPPPDATDSTGRVPEPRRRTARRTILGALVVGGLAGAVILGPLSVLAASPAPSAATSAPAATTAPGARSPGIDTDNDAPGAGGPGGSGHTEAVTDTSVVAKAIGISEADLNTALAGGQTVAAVAAAHNVPLQTVIDALVADGTSELAAQVASGSITQAQADAKKAEILQRATDQANGTFHGGRP